MDFSSRTVSNFLPKIKESSLKRPLAVAAIDFGTTYTGYAVSFNDGKDILTGKDGDILPAERVSSCVLLNEDKTFHSFGNDAMKHYSEISPWARRRRHYLFEMFKMELYKTKELSRETSIYDRENKSMPAFVIFKMVIEHLKELINESISTFKPPDYDIHILWMLSVPAIWLDSARQFMREVAIEAGIPEIDLRLVLEPEAASLYCRNQLMRITESASIDNLPVGYKYILADLGGGTVDICVHEILENGKLRELYRATGNNCGGTCVDVEFSKFMAGIFGQNVWKTFQDQYFSKYISLMTSFEGGKTKFCSKTINISINLGHNLIDVYEKGTTSEDSFENHISSLPFAENITYDSEDMELKLNSKLIEKFFDSPVKGIIGKLTEVLDACEDDNINTVLLVGGFSMAEYVRKRTEEVIKPRIVLEQDARLAVLKGSIMMGFKPKNIIQRRSRFTYGFAGSKPFIEGVHPTQLRFVRDGEMCYSIFKKLIEKDQIVEYNQTFFTETTSYFRNSASKNEDLCIALYKSTLQDPQYCTDETCDLVGNIVLRPPENGWPDVLYGEDQLIVGETEFLVKAFNKTTGQRYEAHMDFL